MRSRARTIRLARNRAEAEQAAAEGRRRAEEAEKAEETEKVRPARIEAAALVLDLGAIAETRSMLAEFGRRLHAIRERHARKERFVERLAAMS